MDAIKALCRSLLVMLLLWMVSLLVYYWPLPEEALQVVSPVERMGQVPAPSGGNQLGLRALQVD